VENFGGEQLGTLVLAVKSLRYLAAVQRLEAGTGRP
jgi:hypothetical protein